MHDRENMVRALAAARGLHSLHALALAAELDPRTVRWAVRGQKRPTTATIAALCRAVPELGPLFAPEASSNG